MFPMGNIRQPLIAGDLHQLVCGVSVEGQIAVDHGPPFTTLHLGVCFSRKRPVSMILSTLFCHAAEIRTAHWVRSVMALIVVMVIAASFESAAGFASRAGARFFREWSV